MADVKDDIRTLNLYQKLAAITGEVGKIEKTGQSTGYGDRYNFIEYASVAGRLRELFAKYGVIIVPYMQRAAQQTRHEIISKNGGKGSAVLIDFTFVVRNADKPDEKFSVTWTGEAIDYGDKATNKAATAALKYYLMRQFNISERGDDPDAETPDSGSADKKPASKPAKKAEVSKDKLKEIQDLSKQAGYGADWYANVVMKLSTDADADAVISKLTETLMKDPEEREWK